MLSCAHIPGLSLFTGVTQCTLGNTSEHRSVQFSALEVQNIYNSWQTVVLGIIHLFIMNELYSVLLQNMQYVIRKDEHLCFSYFIKDIKCLHVLKKKCKKEVLWGCALSALQRDCPPPRFMILCSLYPCDKNLCDDFICFSNC